MKKIEAEKDFNAFSGILSKKNKRVLYREQAFHSIFGMDMGNGIYKQEIKLLPIQFTFRMEIVVMYIQSPIKNDIDELLRGFLLPKTMSLCPGFK
ncbi:hypothetical protein IW15_07025 [Chryseobacterium soli]|uniref:Uncharacterized protein n=1 Tax=Chryseobacterium soli TaxID=445961 RepID=A0A086AA19_9FLAO|nr:hypothetical protein [Chryseobacterium soli]KFF13533.1 hypothetical protein IW15_07025 [Chryseobacterium soli]